MTRLATLFAALVVAVAFVAPGRSGASAPDAELACQVGQVGFVDGKPLLVTRSCN